MPTLEAVETVNVVTNSFDAEQGLAGGAATNLQIKSETNELHGSAIQYHTNQYLQARPYLLPASQTALPKLVYNEFGGTVGGPVIEDKLFFFGSYEGMLYRQNAQRLVNVPTAPVWRVPK